MANALAVRPDLRRAAVRLTRYRSDFVLFAAEQLKIATKSSALEPFVLRPFQAMLHDAIQEQEARTGAVRQVWLKSRQIGTSTLSQGLIFRRTVLHPLVNSIVVAHDVGIAQTIFQMARRFYDNLDRGIKPMVRYCVDDQTECLTRRGWARWGGVAPGDEVYGLDPWTGEGCWTKVRDVFVDEHYDGPMVRWVSQDVDALVTPEHRWLVTTYSRLRRPAGLSRPGQGGKRPGGLPIEPHLRYSFVETSQMSPGHLVPKCAAVRVEDAPITDDLLEIFGWVASEGNYPRGRRTVNIDQSHQVHPDYVEQIRGALVRAGALFSEYHCRPDMTRFAVRGDVARVIRGTMPDKIPVWGLITSLSARQAQCLLDALMKGDGASSGKGYWSADPVLAERVQALALVAGHGSRIIRLKPDARRPVRCRANPRYGSMNWVALHSTQHAWGFAFLRDQKIVQYRGVVWCPDTDVGVILVRRNGIAYFTGQSTKTELVFDNPSDRERESVPGLNSKIIVSTARNIHSGAGGTFHCVHLSEAARYTNPAEIESSTLDTVPMAPGTIVIVESTARPEGHWFRDMCDRARAGASGYEFHFIGWDQDPTCWKPLEPGDALELNDEERDLVARYGLAPEQLNWRRWKLAEKRDDVDAFNQEYPLDYESAWITKEFSVFPVQHLRVLRTGIQPPRYRGYVVAGPKITKATDGPLSVWLEPEAGASYDIGADVALGLEGGDWSTAQVLKRPTGEQVAEFRAHVEPGEFADLLNWLGRWYNLAQIAVEVNNVGYYTNSRLSDVYPNLYIWRRKDTVRQRLSAYVGFESTLKSKAKQLIPLAKDRVYRYVTAGASSSYPLIRSAELLREMSLYVQVPGTDEYHAAPGTNHHDDLVMAWMIAVLAGSDDFGLFGDTGAATPSASPNTEHHDPAFYLTEAEVALSRRQPTFWGDLEGWIR